MRIIFILSVLLLISPETKSQQIQNVEDFRTFLEKFKEDYSFQKTRLISPVTIIYSTDEWEKEEDGVYGLVMDTIQVDAKDWKFESLNFGENVSERTENTLDGSINFTITGLDNGILIVFTFIKRNGKWFLKGYVDQST